jgi:hypothetical protein
LARDEARVFLADDGLAYKAKIAAVDSVSGFGLCGRVIHGARDSTGTARAEAVA